MRKLLILTIGICLFLVSVPAAADQKAEEEAIRKMMADSFVAHDGHDAKATAAYYKDGFIHFTGETTREELVKNAEETYANYKDFHAEQIKEIGIDFLAPDIAIQRRVSKYTSSSGPDGKPVPPLFGLRASVLMKKDGKWIVVAQFDRQMTDEEIKQLKDAQ